MDKVVRFLVWTAVIIGAIVGLARATAIRWWRIPSNDPYLEASVTPTLQGGDLVLLWRLTAPDFGDLVLCPEPGAPERVVVGRIVAEGGNKLAIDGSGFSVDGKPSKVERNCLPPTFETTNPGTGEPVEQKCSVETIHGTSHSRGSVPTDRPTPAGHASEIPPGQVFLLSDNRLFPYDSRDYGTVERSSCVETVLFRLVSREGLFDSENRLSFIK